MSETGTDSAPEIWRSLLALPVIIAAQYGSAYFNDFLLSCCLSPLFAALILSLAYVALSFAGLWWLCRRLLRCTLPQCGVGKFSLSWFWLMAALLLPLLSVGFFMLFPGDWMPSKLAFERPAAVLSFGLLFTGTAVPLVEELTFRGLILRVFARRWNRPAAAVSVSLIFGAVHMLNLRLPLAELMMVFAAMTSLGLMLAAVALCSGSVWNCVWLHMLWNIVIVGHVIHLGAYAEPYSLYNYVLQNKNIYFSGGSFGIEASLPTIFLFLITAYLISRYHPVEKTPYNQPL